MVDVLVRGGDTEAAARELCTAIRDIFGAEPIQSTRGGGNAPATRSPAEAMLIALSIPPALHYGKAILGQAQLGERLRRLIGKAAEQRKATGARLLIDIGDGKPIPLEEAKHETIIAALTAFEQKLKP